MNELNILQIVASSAVFELMQANFSTVITAIVGITLMIMGAEGIKYILSTIIVPHLDAVKINKEFGTNKGQRLVELQRASRKYPGSALGDVYRAKYKRELKTVVDQSESFEEYDEEIDRANSLGWEDFNHEDLEYQYDYDN